MADRNLELRVIGNCAIAALVDPATSVRERAIKLAARSLEPSVLGALVADGENAVRRNAGLSRNPCPGKQFPAGGRPSGEKVASGRSHHPRDRWNARAGLWRYKQ